MKLNPPNIPDSRIPRLLRQLFYFFALAFLLGTTKAWARVDVEKRGSIKFMHFNVDDVKFHPTIIHGQTFQKATLIGVQGYEAVLHLEGLPELPVIRFFASGKIKVEAFSRSPGAALGSGMRLNPAQPSRIKKPNVIESLALNEEAYAGTEMVPQQLYDIQPAGSINGEAQYLVTLYPIAYAPGTGRFDLQGNFKVSISPVQPAPDSKKVEVGKADRERFVFIVGTRFANSPALSNYQAFKQQLGYQISRIDVTTKDTPDSIRAQLKALYGRTDAALRYALIVGDVEDVPAKGSKALTGVTDHYYRAIDTEQYNDDINGPDIGVGRVSVNSETQLAGVLAKFMRYQIGAFTNEDWLNGVSFLASNDKYKVAEGTHNYVIDTYTRTKGYLGVFPAANQAGGDQLYPITHRVTDTMVYNILRANGRAIIDYSGHGSEISWVGPNLPQTDVRKFNDPNALPFVIGNACNTGNFRVAESYGETWERNPNGAIMYWGSMDSTYWDEDDILERAMFDGIFRDGKARLSEITHFANSELWRHYGGVGRSKYYWETYVSFGDPSIDLRTTKTKKITVTGPTDLPLGAEKVVYTVEDDQGPVANLRVALAMAAMDFELAGYTDALGKVSFDIHEASRTQTQLAVTVIGANIPLMRSELKIFD